MINKQQASQPTAEDKPLADSAAHDGHIMQGFAEDHTAVTRHGSRRKTCYFRHVNKNTWITQLCVIDLSPVAKLYRYLGIQTDVNEMSKRQNSVGKSTCVF